MTKRRIQVGRKVIQIKTVNCPRCHGAKEIYVPQQRRSNGIVKGQYRVMGCPRCNGHGWIPA